MPVQHAVRLGAKDALMQLASEAVRVAAQSPFLERAVGRATAVLCCVYLPDAGLPASGASLQERLPVFWRQYHHTKTPALHPQRYRALEGSWLNLADESKTLCCLFRISGVVVKVLTVALYSRCQWSWGADRHGHVTQGGASGCRRLSAGVPL